jgi:hypothetical protein
MDPKTADMAVQVVDAIDAAEAAGDTAKVEELREKLNTGPVSKAYEAATEPGPPGVLDLLGHEVPPQHPAYAVIAESIDAFAGVLKPLKKLQDDVKRLADAKCGKYIREGLVSMKLQEVFTELSAAAVHSACPACPPTRIDPKCKWCKGDGWVSTAVYRNCTVSRE